ncbi:integrase [Salinibacter ruber]|uniref:Integrase n=1 Tax=Salinibacter ruber TaxID=146919 RepID=A0A9X2Q428_9BACT|nr:tyrosine-type recombinase/integrase [Salinibacter ruber]MCS3676326.1 integrase [Salinibacter ruber]MCS3679613.1 integrase [Salinibacter ruber]MCS3699173.1 integrase [Salinibacter ruber]MCS4096928.1 integrase [Salinibacter ruber]MCS4178674.1 integrase [Salinibacter ruber]
MPFKASNSSKYKVEIVLPGYGKTSRLSTKSKRKATAEKMEKALRLIWEDGFYELVEALEPEGPGKGGKIDLPTLYHAWRRDELDELARRVNDPLLKEAVKTFAQTLDYENHRLGARHFLRITVEPSGPLLAGTEARVSWVYEPSHIDRCVRHMIQAEGYKPNTVKNGLWGFLSKFLQDRLGTPDARAILREAERPSEDDRRDVVLSPEALHRVISASEWEVRMFLILKASTGIDKTPILRIRGRDVDEENWSLFVRDNKTRERSARIDLPPVAMYALQMLLKDRRPEERAFRLSKGQLDYRWRKTRKAAGLTPENGYEDGVRLKDLRHTFAAHYLRGGGNIAGLMGRLRHSREEQSLMYGRHETNGHSDMESAAEAMGLELPDRLKEDLSEPESEGRSDWQIPEWWFDRSEPPRLPGEDGPEILDVPDRGGLGGGRKGYSEADYREAIEEAGSISGAARLLDVGKSLVRRQCIRHEIRVPTLDGEVPGDSDSEEE